MVFVLLSIIVTFLYGTFAGWLIHWSIHQRWAGRFYRSHMTHHVKLYPQSDLLSDTYRNPGKDNTTFIFTPLLVVSFLLLEGVLRHFGASIALLCILTVEGLIVGILHDYMHTLFHLRKTFLNRYQWFLRLRELHFIHHKHMQRNLGIFWFGWDHVMGSYEKRP